MAKLCRGASTKAVVVWTQDPKAAFHLPVFGRGCVKMSLLFWSHWANNSTLPILHVLKARHFLSLLLFLLTQWLLLTVKPPGHLAMQLGLAPFT